MKNYTYKLQTSSYSKNGGFQVTNIVVFSKSSGLSERYLRRKIQKDFGIRVENLKICSVN